MNILMNMNSHFHQNLVRSAVNYEGRRPKRIHTLSLPHSVDVCNDNRIYLMKILSSTGFQHPHSDGKKTQF